MPRPSTFRAIVAFLMTFLLNWFWRKYASWVANVRRRRPLNEDSDDTRPKLASNTCQEYLQTQATTNCEETPLVHRLREQLQAECVKREAERLGRIKAESALRRTMLAQRSSVDLSFSTDLGGDISKELDAATASAEADLAALNGGGFMVTPIGRLQSCFRKRFGTPRQGAVVAGGRGILRMDERHNPKCSTEGLAEYSHVWLIYLFHENTNISRRGGVTASSEAIVKSKVRPPRLGGGTKVGLFSTRTPHRPNPIGLSLVRLDRVGPDGELYLSGIDLIDGTPILDVKPYLPFADVPHPAPAPASLGSISGDSDTVTPPAAVAATSYAESAAAALLVKDAKGAAQVEGNDGGGLYDSPAAAAAAAVARMPRWIAEPAVPAVARVRLEEEAAAGLRACAGALEFYRDEPAALWHTVREVLRNDIRSAHMRAADSAAGGGGGVCGSGDAGDQVAVPRCGGGDGAGRGRNGACGIEKVDDSGGGGSGGGGESEERVEPKLCIDNVIVHFRMLQEDGHVSPPGRYAPGLGLTPPGGVGHVTAGTDASIGGGTVTVEEGAAIGNDAKMVAAAGGGGGGAGCRKSTVVVVTAVELRK